MTVGAFTFYNNGKLQLQNGTIDLDADTIVCILLGSGYTRDVAAHSTYSDVSAQEIADADYTAQVVGSIAFSESAGTVTADSADISFGSAVTIEAKWAVFVQRAGVSLAAGDLLVGSVDLDDTSGTATVSSTSSTFSVNTPSGLYTVT